MKQIKYFWRKYKIDLITGLFAVIAYLLAFLWSKEPKQQLLWSLAVTVVATAVVIYARAKDIDFFFLPLRSRADKEDWLGRGKFEYSRTHNAFHITDSFFGFIFSKTLAWSDYRYSFDFKIMKECVGAIVRAVNLSNLVMLQIREDSIRPHIFVNGAFQVWETSDTGLTLSEKLNLDVWYHCILHCDKDSIRIEILKAGKSICDKTWRIPQGSMNFTYKRPEITEPEAIIPFAINLEYGSVGFRNHGQEDALVKDVLVEKLN